MNKKKYSLKYLPVAANDLKEIVDYIQYTLQNPIAAENILNKIEQAILERKKMPESFRKYESSKKRKYPYYRINVGNFTVWYVVIESTMEVRRILYSRRNENNLLA